MSEPALKIADYGPELPEVDTSKGVWLSLEEASRRIGSTVGHLRNQCGNTWGPAGLARKQKNARGAMVWFVHESAAPELKVGVKFVEDENAIFDMSRLERKHKERILFKEKCVLRFASVKTQSNKLGLDSHAIAKLIAPQLAKEFGRQVSARSIERWYADYYRGPDGQRGRAGLVDKRLEKEDDNDGATFDPFFAIFDRYFLQQGEPRIRTCYKVALAVAPVEGVTDIPSLSSVQRHVASIPEDKLVLARLGKKAHDDLCAVHIRRDYTRIIVPGDDGQPFEREMRSDDIWNCDHHIADVMVILGYDKDGKPKIGRPWFTPWLDIRSRRILGWRWSKQAPDATTVLLAFRDAAIRAGHAVPGYVYVDNGKDFDAWFLQGETKRHRQLRIEHDPNAFGGVFGMLDVGVIHAKPFNAKAKPIERFFGTFTNWCRLLPSYCGNTTDTKPERLKDVIARTVATPERLRELAKRGLANGPRVPTFEEFVEQANAVIEHVYNASPHTGHGMESRSPNVIYDAFRHTIRRASEAALSICLVKIAKPQKVTLRGVRYGDYWYGAGDPTLAQFRGEQVYLFIDPDNVRTARVFGRGEEYLCTVEAPKLSAWAVVPHEQLREATAEKNRINRTTKQALRNGLHIHRDATEALVDLTIAQQQRDGHLPPDAPASVEMVRTGFEQAQITEQRIRRAVGAETPAFGGRRLDQDETTEVDADPGSIFSRRTTTDEL